MGRASFVLLGIIVILGGLLRCVYLSQLPAGFHGDEAAYGYNAYSIIQTGADEYGARFPLVFKSFEDYKPALYGYIDIPFVMLLGLTEAATRMPSALFGSLTIIMIFFLTKQLFHSDTLTAVLSSLILAISPWHIMFSRTASEVIISMFFLLVFLYSLLKIKKQYHSGWMFLAICSGFLSFWAYTASRVTIPLIALILLLTTIRKTPKKISASFPIGLLLVVIVLLELFFNNFANNNRFSQVSIFNNPNTKLVLEEQIREDQFTPVAVTRMYHNKLVNYSRTILSNYSKYFSLDFLFLEGGLPPRHRIPNAGLFYIWQLPFLLIGVYIMVRKQEFGGILSLILWPALLVPAIITFDDIPNVQRSIMILPIITIITAYGVSKSIVFVSRKGKRFFWVVLVACIGIALYESLYFFHQYVIHQEYHRPWFRDYAMRPLVAAMNTYAPNYEKVIITKTKTSYIHVLFYNRFDPGSYRASGSNMDKDGTGFGIYQFSSSECPLETDVYGYAKSAKPNTLYVNTGTCPVPKDATAIKTITWQDGNPAYTLVTLNDFPR